MERSLICCQAIDHQIDESQQVSPRSSNVTWRERFYRWRQLRRERHALRHLNDDILKDIGISREAVQREARRPFWDDHGWRR
ncbi:hypothetical protein LCGC14_0029660 [marine sediment metagenome]|uniref:YjiS-like domain-containing protein n=1 Tax=marine sediment metagenome TaxID=412755 RepID=A0A0F9YDZ5_9ZZZZ|nr:DUF1127 domain-containing protein [Halomonas sp.]HDZ49516.1 DUF1127 domain-containing protein [Halomonas sp.]HEB05098.1 DUF1127 domain-containing protein [Halomonas sp.]